MRDAEISRLKKENECLNEKVRDIKKVLVELIRNIAKDMNFITKAKMLIMANELEQSAIARPICAAKLETTDDQDDHTELKANAWQ